MSHSDSPIPSSKEDGQPSGVPDTIQIQLYRRKGVPLTQCRSTRDLPDIPTWSHNWERDSFFTLCAQIRERIPNDIPGVEWPTHAVPYLKPTKHSVGRNFQKLDQNNFEDLFKRAWRMEERRLGDASKVAVHIYAYLTNTSANTPSVGPKAIQRATVPQQPIPRAHVDAAVQRDTSADPESVVERMFSRRPAQHSALLERNEIIDVPDDTPARIRARRMNEEREYHYHPQKRRAEEDLEAEEFAMLPIMVDGIRHPINVRVHVESLRKLLKLPC